MEPAVGVKLAGVLGQVTSLDVLGDVFFGSKSRQKTASLGFCRPHSRRNFWQPQAIVVANSQIASLITQPAAEPKKRR